MYQTVIWATDGSEAADVALTEALHLTEPTGRLVAVHCDQRITGGRAGGVSFLADEQDVRAKIKAQVEQVRAEGRQAELFVRSTHAAPAQVIAAIAEELHADAIVCGTRGLGAFSGAVLGSVAQRLPHVAPCTVVTVPERTRSTTATEPLARNKPPPMKARSEMYETLIWATDGSDGADAALDEALRLASLSGGHLVAVHCDQRLNGRAGGWPALADEDDLRLKIRRQVEELKTDGVDIDLVIRPSHREAADTVAAVAAELDADAIVCGTRGVSAFAGAVLGSFTQRLLHIAPCPVLAVGPRSELNAVLHHASTRAGA